MRPKNLIGNLPHANGADSRLLSVWTTFPSVDGCRYLRRTSPTNGLNGGREKKYLEARSNSTGPRTSLGNLQRLDKKVGHPLRWASLAESVQRWKNFNVFPLGLWLWRPTVPHPHRQHVLGPIAEFVDLPSSSCFTCALKVLVESAMIVASRS